jgi:hypothetical protein
VFGNYLTMFLNGDVSNRPFLGDCKTLKEVKYIKHQFARALKSKENLITLTIYHGFTSVFPGEIWGDRACQRQHWHVQSVIAKAGIQSQKTFKIKRTI